MKKFQKPKLIFFLVVVAMLFGIAATLAMKLPAMASTSCGQVLVKASSWLGGHGVDVRSNGTDMHTKQACDPDGEVYNLNANPPQYGFAWDSVELVNRLYVTKGWFARLTIPAKYNGKATNSGAKWLYTLAAAGYYRGLVAYANGSNYKPVPGDLIVLSNGTFGHVTVVDHIHNNTLYAVDQNGSATGWEKYAYNSSTGAVSMSGGTIAGYVHPTKNNAYVLNHPIVHVSGTLSANETWTSQNIYVVDSQLTISSGITLTIAQGTIVKYVSSSSDSISVSSGGTLKVNGMSTNPVIFTSYKDDSAGGDTNGDGNASSPAPGDYGAAVNVGGSLSNVTVKVAYAEFRYGTQSLFVDCTSASKVSATVTDSVIKSQIFAYACEAGQGKLTLQRNQFQLAANDPNTAVSLHYSDPSGIMLAGTNENTFVGSGRAITVAVVGASGPNYIAADIPAGSTWTIAGTSGVVIEAQQVGIAGTLNLNAGAVVKINSTTSGFYVSSGGALNSIGTSNNPVIFTSDKDDSVGGDTNGDGNASSPTVGDYSTAISSGFGASNTMVSTTHTKFKYANTVLNLSSGEANLESTSISNVFYGLEVSGDAEVTYRGNFSSVTNQAIRSCNWSDQATCTVDAAYTNWGNVNGPLASNPDNNMVCGAVTISPWKYGSSTYTITNNPDVYDVRNCDNSDTPSTQMSSAITNFQGAVSQEQIDCGNGFQDACDAIKTAYACLGGAMNTAQSTTPWPIPSASTADEVNAWGGLFRGAAADYLSTQEVVSVPSSGFLIANDLINLTGTFITMFNAYNSCAP